MNCAGGGNGRNSACSLLPRGARRVDFFNIVALAVVQSVTEFLPVGSEAHVAMASRVLPLADLAESLMIPVHLGTVLAVLVYFHSELLAAVLGTYHLAIGRSGDNARLTVKLFVGSVPVIAVGAALILLDMQPDGETSLLMLGWTMVGFGALLFLADRMGMTLRRIEHMSGATALAIGLAQAIALVPGAGRIGVTMTAARLLGFERTDAARFAMLLGVVPILAFAAWHAWTLARTQGWTMGTEGAIAAGVAFVAALAAIAFLMQWLKRGTLAPFALYRLLIGAALLYTVYA